MQLLLSFAQEPANDVESEIWTTLPPEQRSEAMTVLARLLAKVATVDANKRPDPERKEDNDD